MSEPACATTPADALETEVQDALALCKGDALMALHITLIANAFLEARIPASARWFVGRTQLGRYERCPPGARTVKP